MKGHQRFFLAKFESSSQRAMRVFIRFVEFKNMITLVIRHGLLHMGEKDNLMYTSNRSWSLHDDYDRCAG